MRQGSRFSVLGSLLLDCAIMFCMSERYLERKFTVRAHGKTLVLHKRPIEKPEHRVMMALLWALYLPTYPMMRIDVPIGSRYRPDLVQLDATGAPVFWGESGAVGADKLAYLCRHYAATHLIIAKWTPRLDPVAAQIDLALAGVRRSAPLELIGFSGDAAQYIAADGTVSITFADVERRIWQATAPTAQSRKNTP